MYEYISYFDRIQRADDFYSRNMLLLIILPVVLYGCETWSLTLREERRLWVFENRVLRGIFGPKREK